VRGLPGRIRTDGFFDVKIYIRSAALFRDRFPSFPGEIFRRRPRWSGEEKFFLKSRQIRFFCRHLDLYLEYQIEHSKSIRGGNS
jgi:hypothetical protein